jgi:hypothetical protein
MMIGEVDLGGVFVSAALISGCLALAVLLGIQSLLRRIGFYRIVWHRSLFDLALFVILWSLSTMLLSGLSGSGLAARS